MESDFWQQQRKRDDEHWNRQFRCKVFTLMMMVCIVVLQIICLIAPTKKPSGSMPMSEVESVASLPKDSRLPTPPIFAGDTAESSRNP